MIESEGRMLNSTKNATNIPKRYRNKMLTAQKYSSHGNLSPGPHYLALKTILINSTYITIIMKKLRNIPMLRDLPLLFVFSGDNTGFFLQIK